MQVMEHLSSILQSCEAPGAILKFHSTRTLAEQHRTPVTFSSRLGCGSPNGDDGHVRQWLVESHQHESQAGEDGKAAFAQNLGREVSSQGMGGGGQKEGRRHRLRAPVMELRPIGAYQSAQHLLCQLSLSTHDMDGANLRSQAGLLLWGTLLGFPADSSPQAGSCA